MSARVRVDDYRRRALELVNSGQAQAESLPGSLVTACGTGAYVEVGVWVAESKLDAPKRCKCWRRFGPCARCAEVEPQQSGPIAALLDAVGAETLL